MNLIEQQTAAKELPMQYLQQAVNGQNPNLTPWIATAELQRRTTMNQHMQNAQGAQGPQPTVKDQVEQKAGLMATQAAQQAQAAQAQQSSTPPGPVPGGIPQPEPQSEEPIMAARGGLMNAPVSFQFAHGGILGYAGPQGSQVKDPDADQLERDHAAVIEGLKQFGYATKDIGAMPFRAASALLNTLIVRPARAVSGANIPYFPMMGGGDKSSVTPYTDRAYQEKQAAKPSSPEPEQPYPDRVAAGRQPALANISPGQGILSALPKPPAPPTGGPQRPPAPGPVTPQAPPQAQQPTQEVNPLGQALTKYATEPVPARTTQDAINDMRALRKESGVDQPIGVNESAQQARQDEAQRRQQEQAKKLAWSAFVQGTVGTPGSGSLAYDQTMANALGKEAEYGQSKYKNIADLETARRAMGKDYQTGLESTTAADRLAAANATQNKATVGANVYGTQEHSKASKYSADKHAESSMAITKLQERMANARQGSAEARLAASELRNQEQAIEADIKALTSQRNKLSGSLLPADRKELEYVDAELKNAREQHSLVRGAKGAAPGTTPAPTARLKFDAQGNQIK